MTKNLEEVMRRTYRYPYEDGLIEMAQGVLFTLIGLVILGFDRAQGDPILLLVVSLGLMAAIMAGAFAVRRAVHRIKDRVTAPRTGVITHRREPSPWRWWIIGLTIVLVVASFFLPEAYSAVPVMQGGLLTIILVFEGIRTSLRRLQVTALFPLIAGLLASYFQLGDLLGTALVFTATGLLMAFIGGLAFIRFLQNNPLPHEEG